MVVVEDAGRQRQVFRSGGYRPKMLAIGTGGCRALIVISVALRIAAIEQTFA